MININTDSKEKANAIPEIFGTSSDDINLAITNPIALENIRRISINYWGGRYRPSFDGLIEFSKENTSLKQAFEGENLTDLFLKIADFCTKLKEMEESK